MTECMFEEVRLQAFCSWLRAQERSRGTTEKYLRDVRSLRQFVAGRSITKDLVISWKAWLLQKGFAPKTVNSMLTAVNRYLTFVGAEECRVQTLKIQRKLFRESARELTRAEYQRLVSAAMQKKDQRLTLLLQTICATGIRVSEVPYITVEAVRNGRVEVSLKGKIRVILLPQKLCQKLCLYAKKKKIAFGTIFRTRGGRDLSRKQIWAEMKRLCSLAKVLPSKVFPHNLRHLFARAFYAIEHDLALLADVLGHSSIETTRIYIVSTGAEHARRIEQLGLIS